MGAFDFQITNRFRRTCEGPVNTFACSRRYRRSTKGVRASQSYLLVDRCTFSNISEETDFSGGVRSTDVALLEEEVHCRG